MEKTLAIKFKAKAKELMPGQDGLQDLDGDINSAGHIDEIMFRKSEYLGGMAAVILAILKRQDGSRSRMIGSYPKAFNGLS